MFGAIQSLHRPRAPITRVTAALPDLPHPHSKPQRGLGAVPMVGAVAGLVVLIGTAAVMLRGKLMAIINRVLGADIKLPTLRRGEPRL